MNGTLVPRPAEPEDADRKRCSSRDGNRQLPLGHHLAVIHLRLFHDPSLHAEYASHAKNLADNQSKIWQTTDAGPHAVNLLEDNWIADKEQVKESIDERTEQTHQKYNGVGDKHLQWKSQVVDDKDFQVN